MLTSKGVIMVWYQVLTILFSTIGCCWMMHRENIRMHQSYAKEMKDFHGRMCTIEERYVQMMQRILEKK